MAILTRRSLLRSSLALAATAGAARPYIANAAATTAELWWVQGFAQEEDVAFKKMLADYEKASGNKIEDSIIPFAPMRQKAVSAITAGVVPDVIELADFSFLPLNAWADKLVDVSDIVAPPEVAIYRYRAPRHLLLQQRHETARLLCSSDEGSGREFRFIFGSLWSRKRVSRPPIFPIHGTPSSISSCRYRTNRGCATSTPTAIS
jgi:hypothetical protein